jgi:hypothetical protein
MTSLTQSYIVIGKFRIQFLPKFPIKPKHKFRFIFLVRFNLMRKTEVNNTKIKLVLGFKRQKLGLFQVLRYRIKQIFQKGFFAKIILKFCVFESIFEKKEVKTLMIMSRNI